MTKLNCCGQVVKGLLISVNVFLLVSTAVCVLTRQQPTIHAARFRYTCVMVILVAKRACMHELLLVVLSLQLLGLFVIGAGAAGLVENVLDLTYVTGSDVFSGEVVIIAAGVGIIIMAALGIAAGVGEMWGIVFFVSESCLKYQFCCFIYEPVGRNVARLKCTFAHYFFICLPVTSKIEQ